MKEPAALKKKDIIFTAILIAAVFLIYFKTLDYDLVYDSKLYLTKGPLYTKDYPLTAAFNSSYSGKTGEQNDGRYYRPLTNLSFLVEKKVWGLNSVNLRLVNISIFSLFLIFLFIFFKRQTETESDDVPYLAVGLLAFFPITLDNIAWIVGRSDLFLMLWGILTLLALEFYLKKKKYYLLFLSSFFYTLGVLSKESTLFFIPVLFIYEYVKTKKITPLYHLTNIFITLAFLVIKSTVIKTVLLKFSFSSGFLQTIKMGTAALGYYFKSIFYPFDYDFYLPLNSLITPVNILSGILLLLLLIFLFFLALKEKEKRIFIPLSLVVFFLFGHLLLVYSPIPIFRVSSRFMMIPAVGFIWIFCLFLKRLKPLVRYTVFFALVLSFIPVLFINASAYKNEVSYWEKCYESFPEDSYVLAKLASARFEKKPIESLFLLNKALKKNLDSTTFLDISFLYEEVEFRRGNYEKAFQWLDRMKPYANVEQQKEIAIRKARIYRALGEIETVERILQSSIKGYDEEKYYRFLYTLYLGFRSWEKAGEIEDAAGKKYPGLFKASANQVKEEFRRSNVNQRLAYFVEYGNYKEAIGILESFPESFRRDLLLVKLYYRYGNPMQGEAIVKDLAAKNAGKFEIYNSLGIFFLEEMLMVDRAYFFFRKSLAIKADQPELIRWVDYLGKHFRLAI